MNDQLVALSVLELELRDGWSLDLGDVAVVEDAVGRRAVSRDDARRLLAVYRERAEREAEQARLHREKVEREAERRDREFRAQLHPGIPHGAFGDVDPIIAQIEAEKAADPRRRKLQDELWARKFGRKSVDEYAYTYHPINELAGEDG